MRRIFSLCFSEITLETSRNDARIFERNFIESSQGQRTKFAHFALITFSQYCKQVKINYSVFLESFHVAMVTDYITTVDTSLLSNNWCFIRNHNIAFYYVSYKHSNKNVS